MQNFTNKNLIKNKNDLFFLNPKKISVTIGIFYLLIWFSVILFFTFLTFFISEDEIALYSFLITGGSLIIFEIIGLIVLYTLRAKKLLKFNEINRENNLVEIIRWKPHVTSIEQFKSEKVDEMIIPDNLLVSFYWNLQLFKQSPNYLLENDKFSEPLQFCYGIYWLANKSKKIKLPYFAYHKKVLFVRVPSLCNETFYLAYQKNNFANPNQIMINKKQFNLCENVDFLNVYVPENSTTEFLKKLNFPFLKNEIFNPLLENRILDLYNDEKSAVLMFAIDSSFMNSYLNKKQNINCYNEILSENANYNLAVLELVEVLKKIIVSNLIENKNSDTAINLNV